MFSPKKRFTPKCLLHLEPLHRFVSNPKIMKKRISLLFRQFIAYMMTTKQKPVEPTMTLMEFHEAARAIAERNGFGDYTTAVNANIWQYSHHNPPTPIFKFRVSMVSKSNVATSIDEVQSPQAALIIFENELIRMSLRKSDETVADMSIA